MKAIASVFVISSVGTTFIVQMNKRLEFGHIFFGFEKPRTFWDVEAGLKYYGFTEFSFPVMQRDMVTWRI